MACVSREGGIEKGCWGGIEVGLLKAVAHLACCGLALDCCMAVKASPAQSNEYDCWIAVMVDGGVCCCEVMVMVWCGVVGECVVQPEAGALL